MPPHAVSRAPRPIPLRRKLLYALATCGAALLILAVGAEVALRIVYRRIERITGAAEWRPSTWQGLTYYWHAYHPRFGWTNAPGYRSGPEVPYRVTIDARGRRAAPEAAPRDRPATRRIAVFGDSCVFGDEVDDDQTLPAHLARRLEGVEVLNFGVNGYGLGQCVLRMEDEAFDPRPDHIVIVLLLPADVARDPVEHFGYSKPAFRVVDGRLVVSNVPVPTASRQPWLLRHVFSAAYVVGRPRRWPAPVSLAEHLDIAHALLRRAKAACDARGVGLTLVNVVVAGTIDEARADRRQHELLERMRRSLAAAELDVLDLIDELRAAYEREGRALVAPRAHWSDRGNCLIADRIAAHLVDRVTGWRLASRADPCGAAPAAEP